MEKLPDKYVSYDDRETGDQPLHLEKRCAFEVCATPVC
jgi:hypothetical protein